MRTHTIICPDCGSRACIVKTNRIHAHIANVYYVCRNEQCGARFVYELTYSHHTHPSALKNDQRTADFIATLTPEKRKELREMLK